MSNFVRKKVVFLAFAILATTSVLLLSACKKLVGNELPGTLDGDTRLVVGMHDAVQQSIARSVGNGKNISGIQALNLIVRQMVIIDTNGKHTTILDEDRNMDILGVSRSDPVILSNVSVEPGVYQELRLVLQNENTIIVNGETHPIKIPSGEQSGLKLKGIFTIPKGKLFSLMIELDTAESVSWNQGQGYRLQPVLRVSNGPEVLGIFRGKMTVYGGIGAGESLVELRSDGTARMRVASYPRYTVWGRYNYNSVTKMLYMDNFDLGAPGLRQRRIDRIMKEFPEEVRLPVKQWSLDNIIAIDTAGIEANLYRVAGFDFSHSAAFTEFVLNVDYPDSTSSGKDVAAIIEFIDTGMPVQTITGTLEGSRFTERVLIPNDYLLSSNTRLKITGYLFDSPDDLNTEIGVYASVLTEIMTGSRFSASTVNPWQPPAVFTLQRDAGFEQEFTVAFPLHMNVRMDHGNFTNNNPVVSWSPFPGAANGYFVMVTVQNKDFDPVQGNTSGNRPYKPAFYQHTFDTSITVNSEMITFTPEASRPQTITVGDIIIAEVYALDDSGVLDTANKKGALSMDALRVVRK